MRSRTEPHAPAHRTDCCLPTCPPACSYLRRPATSEGLSGLDQSSARTQSNGTNSAAPPSRCRTSNSASLPSSPSHAHPRHNQSARRDSVGVGAGAALAQGSPASPGVRAHRALHCKGIFTCAFFLFSRAPFFLSSTRDGDRRVACPLLCNGVQGAATPR